MHRSEEDGSPGTDFPPELPEGADHADIQRPRDGAGPLFHRLYRTRIRDTRESPESLIDAVSGDPDQVAPSEFASFQKTRGAEGSMRVDDEFLVRMPGPWNGPVRVVERTPRSFRYATLAGHLEAGQIELRASESDGLVEFAIESWARPGDRLSELMHHRLRMAKEVQLHMWTSLLERVADRCGGRLTGGIDTDTRVVRDAPEWP